MPIDTITASENTRTLYIDLAQYRSYDIVFGIFDGFEITPSEDWIYFAANTSTPSGGQWTSKRSSFIGYAFAFIKSEEWANYALNAPSTMANAGLNNPGTTAAESLLIYTYDENKSIKAGSKIKVYGVKFTDI